MMGQGLVTTTRIYTMTLSGSMSVRRNLITCPPKCLKVSHIPLIQCLGNISEKKKKNKQDFFTLHVTIEICYIKLIKWSIWSHVKNFKIFFTIFYTFLYSSKFLNTTFCALQKLCKFINISCFCLLIRSQNDQVKLILII